MLKIIKKLFEGFSLKECLKFGSVPLDRKLGVSVEDLVLGKVL